jgi:hypothetical protein
VFPAFQDTLLGAELYLIIAFGVLTGYQISNNRFNSIQTSRVFWFNQNIQNTSRHNHPTLTGAQVMTLPVPILEQDFAAGV